MQKTIQFTFRWPLKQISPKAVEVSIPTGPDAPSIINPEFASAMQLSDGELERAENAVLRTTAIIE